MKKLRIAVDFDDVVADFNRAFIAYMHTVLPNCTVRYETQTSFFFDEVYGIPQAQMLEHLERFCRLHHDEIRPISGAFAGLQVLAQHNDVHLLTSRCESLLDTTCNWLSARRMNIFHDYHFTNSASVIHPDRKRLKSEVCVAIQADVLIDDAIHNAQDVVQVGTKVIVPKRPWNMDVLPDGAVHVGNWKRIPSLIQQLAA